MAEDFTMDVWVEVVTTVGVGTVGVKFTGVFGVGVFGMGWAITLTLYLGEYSGSYLLSIHIGSWGFSVHGIVILGRGAGAWLQLALGRGLGLGPSLPSSSRYILIFQMREG